MKGTILHITDNKFVIRAENNDKLEASISEIKSDLSPRVGDEVDFELSEQGVHCVYILRQSPSLDDHIEKTKEVAGSLYSQAKNSINEENVQKAKALASEAANKAKETFKNVDLAKATDTIKSVNISSVEKYPLYNKFSLIVLVTIFISMLLPLVKIPFASPQSYFQMVDATNLQVIFFILSAASLVLGLPRLITRICSIVFLVTLTMPIYDAINFLHDMRQATSARTFTREAYKMIEFGLPVLLLSTVLFTLIQVLPWYQTSPKFLQSNNEKE